MTGVRPKAEPAQTGNQDKRGPGTNGLLTGELFAKFLQSRDYQSVDVTIERLLRCKGRSTAGLR
jgi:hypothetical protein